MKVWITSVVVLFWMVETYQWMRHFTLPLPVFILGGALLAIASNYGKYAGWSFQQPDQAEPNRVKTSHLGDFTSTNWPNLNRSSSSSMPQLARPISFTISRGEGNEKS
jgi:hypothetical protein